jgi:hypothetical protein
MQTVTRTDALEFTWDANSQRYRIISGAGKGQFVGQQAMEALSRKAIAQLSTDREVITTLLLTEKINVATWEKAQAQALKQLEITSYALGRGGIGQMNQRDYGLIGARLRSQYTELRKFSEDIQAGKLTPAQIRARARMFHSGSRGGLEAGREESHNKAGFRWERRRRTKTESCVPCVEYEKRGWVPIGTLPTPTVACTCRFNCGCYKVFSRERPTQDEVPEWGWVA